MDDDTAIFNHLDNLVHQQGRNRADNALQVMVEEPEMDTFGGSQHYNQAIRPFNSQSPCQRVGVCGGRNLL